MQTGGTANHADLLVSSDLDNIVDRETWEKSLREWEDNEEAAYRKLAVVKSVLTAREVEAHPLEGDGVPPEVRESVKAALLRARLGLAALAGEWSIVSTSELESLKKRGPTTFNRLVEEGKTKFLIRTSNDISKDIGLSAKREVVGYLFRLVKAPDAKDAVVRYGNVETMGIYALVFKSEEKTIRIEVLAKEVKKLVGTGESQDRLFTSLQKVNTPLGEMYRVASFSISTKGGMPTTPHLYLQDLNVEISFFLLDGKPSRALLWGLGLTDLGTDAWGNSSLNSPDVVLHCLFCMASGRLSTARIHDINLTDFGPSVTFVTTAKTGLPPKALVWELFRALATGKAESITLKKNIDLKQLSERLISAKSLDEALAVLKEYFSAVERVKAKARRERMYVIKDGVEEVRPESWKRRNVIYVPRRLLFELVDAMREADFWLGLLVGDGVVILGLNKLGFAVGDEFAEAAGLLMSLFALRYGIRTVPEIGDNKACFDVETSKTLIAKLFEELRQSGKLRELAEAVKWWRSLGMPGGSNPPKLISLMALYERTCGETDYLTESAFRLWMEYKGEVFKKALDKAPHVMAVADNAYVISLEESEKGAEVKFAYPIKIGQEVAWYEYRLWTDWRLYRLYCVSGYDKLSELARSIDEEAREEEGRFKLSARVGKALYYILKRRYIYVQMSSGEVNFRGSCWVYTNNAEDIYKGRLRKLDTSRLSDGRIGGLECASASRRELLRRVGYKPEEALVAKPASVKHLGGMRFEVEDRVVEFVESKQLSQPLYAVVQFNTADEAKLFYRRLLTAGVYAKYVEREVMLDDESFWGMVAVSGITPEGYQRLYPLEGDRYRDLFVFKRTDGEGLYYQFVVKVEGVWRATGRKYSEKNQRVILKHADSIVLKALRVAVRKAIDAELGEIGEDYGVYYVQVYRPVLEKFEERALTSKPLEKPEVRVEGGLIVIKYGRVECRVEFTLVRGRGGVPLCGAGLHKALKTLGVPAIWMPEGLKVGRDGMWGLLATAVEEALRRREQLKLPEGVSLIRARPERGYYVFRVKAKGGQYVYSVLKIEGQWTAMGGKVDNRGEIEFTHSKETVAKAHAEAINELLAKCITEGLCSKKVPRPTSDGRAWRFRLNVSELKQIER